jgi:uncharacterized protein (DUF934 family)
MRSILRRHELIADDWRHLGEDPTADASFDGGVIVPLARLRTEPAWLGCSGRLGVRLSPTDRVDELGELLPRLALVAVEFPSAGDGRGYSQARLLRERLGFRGELRAVGNGVRRDQVFLLARCGFDALELPPGEDAEAARQALRRYDVAYQPGSPEIALRRQRFERNSA